MRETVWFNSGLELVLRKLLAIEDSGFRLILRKFYATHNKHRPAADHEDFPIPNACKLLACLLIKAVTVLHV